MKKLIVILNVFFIIGTSYIASGCSQNAEPHPSPVVNCTADADRVYFPEEDISTDFGYQWYTAQMTAFQEPSLYQMKDDDKTIYRVTILPSFSEPFMVRVEINPEQNSGILIFKQTTMLSEFTAKLYEPKIISLTSDQIEALQKILDEKEFWTIPTNGGSEGFDGEEYIIEGYANGKYHLVVRWSPEYDVQDGVFDIALSFMKLANIDIKNLFQVN